MATTITILMLLISLGLPIVACVARNELTDWEKAFLILTWIAFMWWWLAYAFFGLA